MSVVTISYVIGPSSGIVLQFVVLSHALSSAKSKDNFLNRQSMLSATEVTAGSLPMFKAGHLHDPTSTTPQRLDHFHVMS